jgi:hypothetical protein
MLETDCQAIVTIWSIEKTNRSFGFHVFKDMKEIEGFRVSYFSMQRGRRILLLIYVLEKHLVQIMLLI